MPCLPHEQLWIYRNLVLSSLAEAQGQASVPHFELQLILLVLFTVLPRCADSYSAGIRSWDCPVMLLLFYRICEARQPSPTWMMCG